MVDENYLILLVVLSSHKLIDLRKITGMKSGYVDLSTRYGKVFIKTNNKEEANKAIENISDFIDHLSVIKL